MRNFFYLILIILILVGGGYVWLYGVPSQFSFSNLQATFVPTQKPNYESGSTVSFADTVVQVEIADTEAKQERGLSGRDSLPPNTGMLFVFKEPAAYQFWMKDMKFPIDIIWLAADQTITYIKQNATPDSYPTIFEPPYLSLYVLEVPAGFAEAHGLNIGDQAVIKR
jgi:uncharacterized membrane protein (UPF0127 family)